MSGFPILDLVVGIIFIYFLLSIICSSAAELWFSLLKTRARLLEQWVRKIFDKPALDSQGNPALNPDGSIVTLGQSIIDHCMGAGAFYTPDCRATYEELKAKGVVFKSEPKEQFYGIEAIITDGSGNWFSMTQPKEG